jgi:hypothetical protein
VKLSPPRRRRAQPSGGRCRGSEGVESDSVAERFESFDETTSDLLSVVLVKVDASEIRVGTVMLEEVVDGQKYRSVRAVR